MKAVATAISDVLVLEPRVFEDSRGHFFESFNHGQFEEVIGHKISFVQDNQSRSRMNVLRGLHYQLPPKPQGKLVRVVSGEIFDVAVDVRRGSPSFGKWVGEVLSSENRKQLWIPAGFAHGFRTLSETADVMYKTTDYYSFAHERSVRWDDADLKIDWSNGNSFSAILSDKDAEAKAFRDADLFA